MEFKIVTGASGTQIIKKMELVSSDNPILKQKTPAWDFRFPPIPSATLANQMVDALQHYKGLGLACPQVGLPYRMFAMGYGDEIVACFNPLMFDYSVDTDILSEGCLSFPDLFIKIRRPKRISVEYYDYNGVKHQMHLHGISARVFQHELNHLDGILFTDIAGKMALQIAKKKMMKGKK